MANLKNNEFEINNLINENTTKSSSKSTKLNKFSKYMDRLLNTSHKKSVDEKHAEVELKALNEICNETKGGDVNVEGVGEGEEERMRWDSFMEYFLSIIGFVIDLGNVWRFPTVCYENGGGAFLIPFLVCLFVIGMPCMYLELAAGQYFQSGNITIWSKMCPYMKGIGYSVVIINILMLSYYNTLQAYALYYLGFSFQSPVPWSSCDKPWSTSVCHVENENTTFVGTETNSSKRTVVYLPTSEFFKRKVLGAHLSQGFDDPAGFKLDLLFCLLIIFLLTTSCLLGGIKSSGKAVYVTALLPYVCLIVLITQSFLLDGAMDGLVYYLKPDFTRIFELKVWIAAAVQIFFSLGPGFGVLITYSSYTTKQTNIKKLTILCSIVNCLTSLAYGLVVFAGLGYMAKRLNVAINYFLDDGIGLVFIVYPEIISTFKGAPIYAIVFFIMLISLGMDSAFGGMEAVYTALVDEFPVFRKHQLLTRFLICGIPFVTAIPTISYAGIYVVQWLDRFAISPSVLMIVFVEVMTVAWLYTTERFCEHIKEMNGKIPFIMWQYSWKYICPLTLITIVILDSVFFQPLKFGTYYFPQWSIWLGYLLNFISLIPIPGYLAFYFLYPKFKRSIS